MPAHTPKQITVIGLHEDGWNGLLPPAQNQLLQSTCIYGGKRHLDMLPEAVKAKAKFNIWPSPLKPFLEDLSQHYTELLEQHANICMLASANPMLYGIGASLAKYLPANAITILPQASIQALVCAKMKWPEQETTLINLCGRPLDSLNQELFDKNRLIILSEDQNTPYKVAKTLALSDFDDSEMSIFENLSGNSEKHYDFLAKEIQETNSFSKLNTIALTLHRSEHTKINAKSAGLPDSTYLHDGQITKAEIRTITIAALSPRPDELLWDIGAGSGSISIEWMRSAPKAKAIAIEPKAARITNIQQNAKRLGVPALTIQQGKVATFIDNLPRPDAIFIGGGLTSSDMLIEQCLTQLKPGGRLVINAVTLSGETLLYKAYQHHGGALTRIEISKPNKIGRFDSWQPARPVTQWQITKPWQKETL